MEEKKSNLTKLENEMEMVQTAANHVWDKINIIRYSLDMVPEECNVAEEIKILKRTRIEELSSKVDALTNQLYGMNTELNHILDEVKKQK